MCSVINTWVVHATDVIYIAVELETRERFRIPDS